jgi:hypothetical protein
MFLWCGCHCTPEASSESFASSYGGSVQGESASQSVDSAGPPQVPVVDCVPCRFGIAPAVLEFEWNYTGKAQNAFPPRPCCASYSTQKKYRLYKRVPRPFEFTTCRWTSNEVSRREVRVPQPFPLFPKVECEDTREPRVMFELERLTPTTVRGLLRVFFGGTAFQAEYLLVDDAGNQQIDLGQGVECLRPMRFRGIWAFKNNPAIWTGSNWDRQGVPFGSPCDQVRLSAIDLGLPEHATCTAVPA